MPINTMSDCSDYSSSPETANRTVFQDFSLAPVYDMNSCSFNADVGCVSHNDSGIGSPVGAENLPPITCSSGYPHHQSMGMPSRLSSGWQGLNTNCYNYQQGPFLPLFPYQTSAASGMMIDGQLPILGPNGKPKRRRVVTIAQRKAANIRERRRMFNLNEAFDTLRKRVPTFAYEKRLSRIETLRLAITYISFMADVVDGKDPKEVKLATNKGLNWSVWRTPAAEATKEVTTDAS